MQALNSIFQELHGIWLSIISLVEAVTDGFGVVGDYLYNTVEAIATVLGVLFSFVEFFIITLRMGDGFLPPLLIACFVFIFVCIIAKVVVDIFL